MIIHDKFVWLHFPKCAGSTIEWLFKEYFSDQHDVHQDRSLKATDTAVSWHDSLLKRERRDPSFDLGDREVFCSFRRAPRWLESRYNYEYKRTQARNIDWTGQPAKLLDGVFFNTQGVQRHADSVCRNYIPEWLLESGRLKFIRTEHFKTDFVEAFGQHMDLSKIPESAYDRQKNTSINVLPDEIVSKLRSGDESPVYAACPYWSRVEKFAY